MVYTPGTHAGDVASEEKIKNESIPLTSAHLTESQRHQTHDKQPRQRPPQPPVGSQFGCYALRDLADKVRALQTGSKARLETDAEALLEGEGIAARPGPRPRIDLAVVEVLRDGLLGCLQVRIRYRGRIKGDETTRIVHPYGFLFGGRHYLIAEDAERRALRMFSLSNVLEAELLDGYFERDEDFDLKAWASRSFGVYQEDPVDVVWRIAPEAADDASEYLFHPTQRIEREPDGSLLVRFRAGGLREMCWHAFEWRGQLEIVEPAELREEFVRMLEATLEAQRG